MKCTRALAPALSLVLSFALCLGLVPPALHGQTTYALAPVARQQFFDNNGYPLAGGLLYTFASGTAIPLATYQDGTGTTPNTNPIVLDAGGFASIWLPGSVYTFTLKSAAGVQQWSRDGVTSLSLFAGAAAGSGININSGIISTTYNGLDAFSYCPNPAVHDDGCVIAALQTGISSTVIVPSGIPINNQINIPPNTLVVWNAGTYTWGNGARIVHDYGSKEFCPAGPDATTFSIPATYTGTNGSMIEMTNASNLPAGAFEGCGFSLPQPDSSNLATYNTFGNAWVIHAMSPRAHVHGVKIVGGWNGIKLDGCLVGSTCAPNYPNSGGAYLSDIQTICYHQNLTIDGAADATHVWGFHVWPFGPNNGGIATGAQVVAFATTAVSAFLFGRADTVFMESSFSYAGGGMTLYQSTQGVPEVYCNGVGLENGGIAMTAPGGNLSYHGGYIGLNNQAQIAFTQTAGLTQMGGTRIYLAIAAGTGTAVSNPLMQVLSTGKFIGSNLYVDMVDADEQIFFATGASTQLSLDHIGINYLPNKAYTNAVFNLGSAGPTFISIDHIVFPNVGSGSHVWAVNGSTTTTGFIDHITQQGMTPLGLTSAAGLHLDSIY